MRIYNQGINTPRDRKIVDIVHSVYTEACRRYPIFPPVEKKVIGPDMEFMDALGLQEIDHFEIMLSVMEKFNLDEIKCGYQETLNTIRDISELVKNTPEEAFVEKEVPVS